MWASVLDEHRRYLASERRLALFSEALAEVVRPGSVVVDLGAGTGVLGIAAVRAGAGRVYAIEASGLVGLARELIQRNGFADRITCIRGRSTDVDLPEAADLVVGDQLDGFVVDAGLLGSFEDARRRFLRPSGVTMPSVVEWWLTPVALPAQRDRRRFWTEPLAPLGLDISAAAAAEMSARRYGDIPVEDVLGSPVGPISAEVGTSPARLHADGPSTIARAGQVDALAGWFRARLSPSVHMTNDPGSPERIDRGVALLPLAEPYVVEPGNVLDIEVDVRPASSLLAWRVSAAGRPGRRQSSISSEVLSKEDLARAHPLFRPVLNRSGDARRRLLNMCDGAHTRAQIEAALLESWEGASPASVAELVSRALSECAGPGPDGS